jgi:pre-rRNA-processing protein TSR4
MATYPCVPDSADSHDIYEVFDVDTAKPWQVLSHYFPDKVGGRPAWLSLKPLPSYENLQCGRCKKPCVFLLQKYAPTESLHRTIFLFICRDPACCQPNSSDNLIVLRSQLPFDNDFYARQPPDEDYFDMSVDYPRADKFVSLCVVCGCAGSKQCGRCHQVTYCSREHQREDWLSGHKSVCSSSSNAGLLSQSEFRFGCGLTFSTMLCGAVYLQTKSSVFCTGNRLLLSISWTPSSTS